MSLQRVLVVDDDPDITDYLSSFLRDHDYEVNTADNAQAAMDLLDDGKFDPEVILVDVLMPGRSGLDFLVQIRRTEKWRNVYIVMITGSDQILEDDCQSYVDSFEDVRGPDGMLGKPVDRETLLAVLDQLSQESKK